LKFGDENPTNANKTNGVNVTTYNNVDAFSTNPKNHTELNHDKLFKIMV
jgi:hypothetical protein